MPGSLTSAISEAEVFAQALRDEGCAGLLITEPGRFRARLTRVALSRLRLAAVQEELARIAFIVIPAETVSVLLPVGDKASPVWGGFEMREGEILAFAPGEQLHAVTAGVCSWGAIQVTARELKHYGEALTGNPVRVPPGARWRPSPAIMRRLTALHRAATRMAESRSGALADLETAHGLEQQVMHTLIECLATGPVVEESPTARRHRYTLAGFEELLRAEPQPSISEICVKLRVSERLLRDRCQAYLRISPSRYFRLSRMQQVRRVLLHKNAGTAKVAEIAARYGFRDPGRFATSYRILYGEPPSATLQREKEATAELGLPRIA
jgi:AraC-like DNA-binding protein